LNPPSPPGPPPTIAQLRAALHGLGAAPDGEGWNREELSGLVDADATLVAAAVLVGLVPRTGGLQVLLTRRNDDMRHHPGQVSFPGGRIEPGDLDPVAAAVREAGEEIGLVPGEIQPLGYLDPLATITGFRVLPLVGIITPDYVARPDPREVAEVFEVPLAYLLAPENLLRIVIDAGGRPRQVLEFVDKGMHGQRIWGATASILFNLQERLRAAS
jgi:8-oxo-dGTP pyrophosphatase MutT (NUDIX family)